MQDGGESGARPGPMRSAVGSGAPEPVSFSHGSMESIPVVPSLPPSHSPPDSSGRETLFFTTSRQGPAAAQAASSAGSSESAPLWVSAEQINHIQVSTQLARLLLLGEMIGEDVSFSHVSTRTNLKGCTPSQAGLTVAANVTPPESSPGSGSLWHGPGRARVMMPRGAGRLPSS